MNKAQVISRLKTYLQEEIAILNYKERLVLAIIVGTFVSSFLLFFQPFGVNNYDPTETIRSPFMWSMIGMGFVITLLILFNELFLFSLFIKDTFRWVILLWTIWSIIFLSSGIFMYYNFLGNWHDFKLSSYLEFIGNIGSMSIIPIAGIYFYLRIKGLKETLNQEYKSPEQDQQSAIVSIVAENGKDKLTLPFSNLIYLEAEDNYVAIHHLEDQNLVKTLIRKSLRSIQEQDVHPQLYRCHRSFMINLQHLQHLKGNKNKLNVQIAHVDKPIVVSRQYIDELLLMTSK